MIEEIYKKKYLKRIYTPHKRKKHNIVYYIKKIT